MLLVSLLLVNDLLIILDRREVFSIISLTSCKPCFVVNLSSKDCKIDSSNEVWREQNRRSASSLSFGLISFPFNITRFGNSARSTTRSSSSFPLSLGAAVFGCRKKVPRQASVNLRFSRCGIRADRWTRDARGSSVVSSSIKLFSPLRAVRLPGSAIDSRGFEERLRVSSLVVSDT